MSFVGLDLLFVSCWLFDRIIFQLAITTTLVESGIASNIRKWTKVAVKVKEKGKRKNAKGNINGIEWNDGIFYVFITWTWE